MTEDELRQLMLELADATVGYCMGTHTEEDYLDLIALGETPEKRAAMGKMSGCGLTVRGLWRRAGLQDERLLAPYEPGSVMHTIVTMAQEAGAWKRVAIPEDLYDFSVGDVLFFAHPEHVATVSIALRALWPTLYTIDGGQRDGHGSEMIGRAARQWGQRTIVGAISWPKMWETFHG